MKPRQRVNAMRELRQLGERMEKLVGDAVNHPPHYNAHPSGVECITVVECMSFNLGNAVKYIWRAGEKGAQIQDLEKAVWYLKREIDRLEAAKKKPPTT